MKKKMMKRLVSWVVAAAIVVAMLPVSVLGAPVEGPVAQIGDQTYTTLGAAINAVTDEPTTIKLLHDFNLDTRIEVGSNKNITITADETANIVVTDNTRKGVAFWENSTLTVENITFRTNGQMYAYQDAKVTFRNVELDMNGEMYQFNSDGYYCSAIAAEKPATMIFDNCEVDIKNYPSTGSAIRWNGKGGDVGYAFTIKNGTTLTSSNCYSGFTGTCDIVIDSSIANISNHRGNGSNGSNFDIKNSDVTFANNGSHGLSTGNLYISNSNVTADHNAYIGIAVGGELQISDSSVVTVTENAYGSLGYAAMRLYNNYPFTIDGTSELYIKDNSNTGLYVRQGQLTVSDGAYLEITGNQVTNNQLDGYGGGIYVGYGNHYDPTVVLPADAKIYNNHATNGGDDIYVSQGVNGSSLTFGKVGSDWVLDDCEHLIDGWYQDGENARWQVCDLAEGGEPYAKEYVLENATATVTGLTALKAAHGLDPKDKVSYPGLDKQVKDDDEDWNDDVDAAAGQKVNFQLTSNVPTNLTNYLNPEAVYPPVIGEAKPGEAGAVAVEGRGSYVLTFHDVLDPMLTNFGNYVVKIGDTELTTEQYEVRTPTDGCSFEVSLDLVALYEAGVITDDDIENATLITVTYDATLSEEAEAGTYENKAWVTAPTEWETSKDIVSVNTYALDIFKYDQANSETGLEGAEFELKNSEGVVIATVTSGEDGHVVIDGLDEGTYYLKETKAPEGYVCSSEELEIVIPGSAGADNTVSVRFANSQIPHTGGSGTLMFTIGGAMLMATAGMLLVVSRKRRKA